MIKNIFALIFLLGCLVYSHLALSKFSLPNPRYYSTEHGLSQIAVYDIQQDSNGYIWVSTQLGIDRFDGYNFVNFKQTPIEGEGPSSSFVYDIEIAPNGGLYIGSMNGLDYLNPETSVFEPLLLTNADGTTRQTVNEIHIDNKGIIWACTDKGLFVGQVERREFTLFTTSDSSIPCQSLSSIDNQYMAIGTQNGLSILNKESLKIVKTILEGNRISSIKTESNEGLWVGTNGSGLYKIKVLSESNTIDFGVSKIGIDSGLADSIINDIEISNMGEIWLGTPSGIFIIPEPMESNQAIFFDERIHNQGTNNPHAVVLHMLLDGTIIFGTRNKGFAIVDPRTTMFSRVLFKSEKSVISVTKGRQGQTWTSSEKGLWLLNDALEAQQLFLFAGDYDGLQTTNKLTNIAYDYNSDILWLGTRLGLYRLDDVNNPAEIVPVGLTNISLYSVRPDDGDKLWLGSYNNGLFLFDAKSNEVIHHWDLPFVIDIVHDENNIHWVLTTGGLVKLDGKTYETQTYVSSPAEPNALPYNVVTWLSKYDETQYFIGTQGNGLAMMSFDSSTPNQDPKFSPLFEDTPLSKNSIGSVVKDEKGNYWISTDSSIARVDSKLEKIDFFDDSDGVNRSGYFVGSFAKLDNDFILFSGAEGLTYFHPDDIQTSTTQPLVKLSEISILDKGEDEKILNAHDLPLGDLHATEEIILSADNLMFSAEFVALEYGNPKDIQYAYRLLGYDDRWRYTNAFERSLTYTNLNPGNYQLEVASTNRYGNWDYNALTLKIKVLAPWYQTNIARFLFICLLIATAVLVFKWRMYAVTQQANKLRYLVDKKTKDLEVANEQLTLLSNQDSLTQILNRRGFFELSKQEMSKFTRHKLYFSIVMLDIDHFKSINDNRGHSAGDLVIQKVASCIRTKIRKHDILARWGGEEFILLLPKTDELGAIMAAEKICECIRELVVQFEGEPIKVTISGGAACINDFETIERCIQKADENLYQAKQSGRDRIFQSKKSQSL
ncbi:diguanylate cyclase [Glaciecola sp. MH2013]|uniref:ligand-binding sensor domain-containing diguanylate cyclase n=1 Tax=Glaciecola sp. MH2013 TaxID=2785524 RepID=UPI00189D274B|nr:ligand-binding sensor domain-containing diguanylate cyclase [Glaciecola sp. MH2013]MBF7074195.1 diguanylate cyclase [Glaciecola sp. MH2013]